MNIKEITYEKNPKKTHKLAIFILISSFEIFLVVKQELRLIFFFILTMPCLSAL